MSKIVGALMEIPIEKRNIAIKFLQNLIEKKQKIDKNVYNIYIFFLVEEKNLTLLDQFLSKQE